MSRRWWWSNDDLHSDEWYDVVLFDVLLLQRVDDNFVLSRFICYFRIAWICYDDTFLKVSVHRFKMNQLLDYVRIVDIRSYIVQSGKKKTILFKLLSLNYINSRVSMRFNFSWSFTFHICSTFNLFIISEDDYLWNDHYFRSLLFMRSLNCNETEYDLWKYKLNEFEKYYLIDVLKKY